MGSDFSRSQYEKRVMRYNEQVFDIDSDVVLGNNKFRHYQSPVTNGSPEHCECTSLCYDAMREYAETYGNGGSYPYGLAAKLDYDFGRCRSQCDEEENKRKCAVKYVNKKKT